MQSIGIETGQNAERACWSWGVAHLLELLRLQDAGHILLQDFRRQFPLTYLRPGSYWSRYGMCYSLNITPAGLQSAMSMSF